MLSEFGHRCFDYFVSLFFCRFAFSWNALADVPATSVPELLLPLVEVDLLGDVFGDWLSDLVDPATGAELLVFLECFAVGSVDLEFVECSGHQFHD